MAIISDFQEDENPAPGDTSASSSSSSPPKTYSGKLDPTNPLGFLEKVFEFVAQESDFLATESSEKQVTTLLRAVMEKSKKRKAAEEEEARLKKEKEDKKMKEANKKMKSDANANEASGFDF